MKYSEDRDINDYVKLLVRFGWTAWRTGKNHVRVRDPSGRLTLTVPRDTGDRRMRKNWFSQTRRAARDLEIALPLKNDN